VKLIRCNKGKLLQNITWFRWLISNHIGYVSRLIHLVGNQVLHSCCRYLFRVWSDPLLGKSWIRLCSECDVSGNTITYRTVTQPTTSQCWHDQMQLHVVLLVVTFRRRNNSCLARGRHISHITRHSQLDSILTVVYNPLYRGFQYTLFHCGLDLWPFAAQIGSLHLWPIMRRLRKFGKNPSNIFSRYPVNNLSGRTDAR